LTRSQPWGVKEKVAKTEVAAFLIFILSGIRYRILLEIGWRQPHAAQHACCERGPPHLLFVWRDFGVQSCNWFGALPSGDEVLRLTNRSLVITLHRQDGHVQADAKSILQDIFQSGAEVFTSALFVASVPQVWIISMRASAIFGCIFFRFYRND